MSETPFDVAWTRYREACIAEWACNALLSAAIARQIQAKSAAWPPERLAERRALNARIEAEAAERLRLGTSHTAENIQRREAARIARAADDRAALTDDERDANVAVDVARCAFDAAREHCKAAYWAVRALYAPPSDGRA